MCARVVKVAVVQAAPVAFNSAQSIAKVAKYTVEAANSGADLVVFPYVFSWLHVHNAFELCLSY